MITGSAAVCGVIGDPVGHSLSPLMHNYIAGAMGLDYIYVPCHVAGRDVEAALRGAYALGFAGLNVTVPHKQAVIPYLAELDESVRQIGACNTLVRMNRDGADGTFPAQAGPGPVPFKGYNTDAEGLMRAMAGHGMKIRGRDCLLIGAGGAARAAACLLVREKAASVTILNRSRDKAEVLAESMRKMAAEQAAAAGKDGMIFGQETENQSGSVGMRIRTLALDQWDQLQGDSYLAVQTTSVGMHPNTGHAPIEDRTFYRKVSQAVDVIYTPERTKFMEYVEEAGGQAMGGLDMLIYQGVAAFELWNPGVKAAAEAVAEVRRIMEERLHG